MLKYTTTIHSSIHTASNPVHSIRQVNAGTIGFPNLHLSLPIGFIYSLLIKSIGQKMWISKHGSALFHVSHLACKNMREICGSDFGPRKEITSLSKGPFISSIVKVSVPLCAKLSSKNEVFAGDAVCSLQVLLGEPQKL
eukprot:TRINITY_DN4590_c0_g2_i1.p1 TRINITY_DN4590_c0_g2~~TRINITY_DN4590_c0_g2_i1.p1  ORF type:complete len:139 (-),score=2.32 TRINITY_DN4590_c0_g2_i1:117-533(-)